MLECHSERILGSSNVCDFLFNAFTCFINGKSESESKYTIGYLINVVMFSSPPLLYAVLDVNPTATPDELKQAYRKQALVWHPDRKGGDTVKFQQLQKAYTILSDPEKRAFYDATGNVDDDDTVSHTDTASTTIDLSTLFGTLFGSAPPKPNPKPSRKSRPKRKAKPTQNNRHKEQEPKEPKGPDSVSDVGVRLVDLYKGKSFTLKMNRNILCSDCKGKGGLTQVCDVCQGAGYQPCEMRMGPFLMASNLPCEECCETGETIVDPCATCSGNCVVKSETVLDVVITPGMCEGDRLVFKNQCSESPLYETPGDVLLFIRNIDAEFGSRWNRTGSDLQCDVELSLSESLLGFARTFDDHPSEKQLRVIWTEPVYDGQSICLNGWGMPSVNGFGKLYIRCSVRKEPIQFTKEQTELLCRVFRPDTSDSTFLNKRDAP